MSKLHPVVEVDGEPHKLCPGHGLVRLSEFNIRKSGPRAGKPQSARCRPCNVQHRRDPPPNSGWIPITTEIRNVFRELESRLGRAEACRRIDISPNLWKRLENQKRVQRATAASALQALIEAREKDEVRHKDDILRGAYLRGEQERRPTEPEDFYVRADRNDSWRCAEGQHGRCNGVRRGAKKGKQTQDECMCECHFS